MTPDNEHNWIVNSPIHASGMDLDRIRVLFYCIPRSASTMIFQILCAMFPPGSILRTHLFIPPPPHVWTILSYRDFRDSIVSEWRYRFSATDPLGPTLARVLAGRFFEYARMLTAYQDWIRQWYPGVRSCVLRYESHGGDPHVVYETLCASCPFGDAKKVPPALLDTLCLSQQRVLADSGTSHLMTPGHVGSGESGQYRALEYAQVEPIMDTILTDCLAEHNYPPSKGVTQ